MKSIMVVGIVLLVIGAALMVIGFVPYKDTDKIIDIGKLEVTKTKEKKARIPVAVSGTLLGVGAVLTIVGAAKKGS